MYETLILKHEKPIKVKPKPRTASVSKNKIRYWATKLKNMPKMTVFLRPILSAKGLMKIEKTVPTTKPVNMFAT